jgi:hypothetical protein
MDSMNGKMEGSILVNTKRTKNMVMEFMCIQMAVFSKVNGRLANRMELGI